METVGAAVPMRVLLCAVIYPLLKRSEMSESTSGSTSRCFHRRTKAELDEQLVHKHH